MWFAMMAAFFVSAWRSARYLGSRDPCATRGRWKQRGSARYSAYFGLATGVVWARFTWHVGQGVWWNFDPKQTMTAMRRVHYPHPKPANFEDAERLVVRGAAEGDVFVARHILVKCPSKYNDGSEFEAGA